MNVLLLANDLQKDELLSLPIDDTVQVTCIKKIENFESGQPIDSCIDLLFDNSDERIERLKKINAPLTIINSVVIPLKDMSQDFIRINGWNTFLKRPVIEASFKNELLKIKARDLFLKFGRKIEWISDIPGFVTSRIAASIINEAFFALEENVSTEEEIDIAMKLGTNYPYGPFEWAYKIGLPHIYSLLEALAKEQGRYQVSSLLKQTSLAK